MKLSPTQIRTQLVANGYLVIPNRGKVPAVVGWNRPEFAKRELTPSEKGTVPEKLAQWDVRFPDAPTTGISITGRLRVIDIDVDHSLVGLLMERVAAIAPEVYDRAPSRYGGGAWKIALFVQAPVDDEAFVRIASHKYSDENGVSHGVEIFGGAPTSTGRISRQFGAYGPHTIDEQGNVLVEYCWADGMPDLLQTPMADLPLLSKAQALAICDAFEELAREALWTRAERPPTQDKAVVYDITEETRFDVLQGESGIDYDTLCDLFAYRSDLRVSSSFFDGGSNRNKCQVGWHRGHDCVGAFDHEHAAWHLPAAKKPVDPDEMAEELKDFTKVHGIEVAPSIPNWRECYAGKGRIPKASLHNARLAIVASKVTCTEDVFHNTMMIGHDSAPFRGVVSDAGIASLRVWLSNRYGLDFTEKHVRDAVTTLCHENQFDPLVEMLADAEASWDGVRRLDRLAADYFNAADTPLHSAIMRKTMIAAVARARLPGCKFDYITVTEGEQGIGKSTAWRVLAGDDYFSDVRVIGHDEREVVEQTAGVWILESADLAGMRKAEVETVKAFASRQVDRARPAYGHMLVERPRRFITVGTTNSRRYMMSQEGNRRFWPVLVERAIDMAKLRAVRLQLWGEAAAAQTAGEELTMPQHLEYEVSVAQEERRVENPWEAVLAKMAERVSGSPVGGYEGPAMDVILKVGDLQVVHTVDIYQRVLCLNPSQMHSGTARTVADAMRHLGWVPWKGRIEGAQLRGYSRKR